MQAIPPQAITPDLNKRLCLALSRSVVFENDADLRALFVDRRIQPWEGDIHESASRRARVQALIAVLYNKTNDQGGNALVLFLHVLAESIDIGDSLHNELRGLAAELLEEQLREAIRTLQVSLGECKVENDEISRALMSLEVEKRKLEEQINSLRKLHESELRDLAAFAKKQQRVEQQQLEEQINSLRETYESKLQDLEEQLDHLKVDFDKEQQNAKVLQASLGACGAEKDKVSGKVRRITGIAAVLAVTTMLGIAAWFVWPRIQYAPPVLTGVHYEVDGYNPRLVDLRMASTDGIPALENHTLRLFDLTASLPDLEANFTVQVEVYANAELIGSGALQRQGQVAQLQTLQIAKYPSTSNQDAWQVQPGWETLDLVLVLSRNGKPVSETRTPIRLNPDGRSWFIDPPNLNFVAVVYAVNEGEPRTFDLRANAGDELPVLPGDIVTFPEIWYRANTTSDTKMFIEMHYFRDGEVIPGTYQVRSASKIENGINRFAASSPLSSTVPVDADALLLLLVRDEMALDRLTLPLRGPLSCGMPITRTDLQCAFSIYRNDETCKDTILLPSACLASRIYISMTEKATAFGYSLWEVRAFTGAQNVATTGKARASSVEGLAFDGCSREQCAIDNSLITRWGSDFVIHGEEPQWFEITFSSPVLIDRIELEWQNAYAKEYSVTIIE